LRQFIFVSAFTALAASAYAQDTDYKYDALGRVTESKIIDPSGDVITTKYNYDALGNRTSVEITGIVSQSDPAVFSITGSGANAGNNLSFTINRQGGSDGDYTVNVARTGGSAEQSDYSLATTSHTFSPGDNDDFVFNVETFQDDDPDNETLTLSLSIPPSETGTIASGQGTASVTITDVYTPPVGAPVCAGTNYELCDADGGSFTIQPVVVGKGVTLYSLSSVTAANLSIASVTDGPMNGGGFGFAEIGTVSNADINQNGQANALTVAHLLVDVSELHGTAFKDLIVLRECRDTVYGGGGDDTIFGGSGDDHIYGAGTDTAHFSGTIDDYTIVDSTSQYYTVTGPQSEGEDRIFKTIEYAQFGAGAPVLLTDWISGGILTESAIFSVNDPSTEEGNDLIFTVAKLDGSDGPYSVDYAVTNGTATTDDYTPISGTLTFAAGQTSLPVSVETTPDSDPENDETIALNLSNPTNGATIADGGNLGLGTIVDNDAPATEVVLTLYKPTPNPDALIVTLSDAYAINPSDFPNNEFSVVAEYTGPLTDDRVRFYINGSQVQNEGSPPYALAGDDPGGAGPNGRDLNGEPLPTQNFTLEARVFDNANNQIATRTINFTVAQ